MYRHLQTIHPTHIHTENIYTQCTCRHTELARTGHTRHTGAHHSLSRTHKHTHMHSVYTTLHTHVYPRPQVRVHTQFCLSLPSSLSLHPPPLSLPLIIGISDADYYKASSSTSPTWREWSRWNPLTVFCASSLPFFCFLG